MAASPSAVAAASSRPGPGLSTQSPPSSSTRAFACVCRWLNPTLARLSEKMETGVGGEAWWGSHWDLSASLQVRTGNPSRRPGPPAHGVLGHSPQPHSLGMRRLSQVRIADPELEQSGLGGLRGPAAGAQLCQGPAKSPPAAPSSSQRGGLGPRCFFLPLGLE